MPAGGNSRFRGYPARMSERQQLALILQMTSQEITSGQSSSRSESTLPSNNTRSSPLHQKSSKSRWSNKNADLLDVSNSYSRQDDRLRLNGCNSKERNEFAGSSSPDELQVRTASPVAAESPAECAAEELPSDEMRRTPPQNKVDRQGSSSPRVTLRLNQVRAGRDDSKKQQQSVNATPRSSSSTMESSSPNAASSTLAAEGAESSGDVYEFKSSKEATPVRGTSTSPNPDKENKDKDRENRESNAGAGNTATGSTAGVGTTSSSTATSTTITSSSPNNPQNPSGTIPADSLSASVATAMLDEPMTAASPQSSSSSTTSTTKRAFESEGGPGDEQDEEGRKRKKKDATDSNPKESAKSSKQTSAVITSKSGQSSSEKSPSALNANSPKPSTTSTASSNNTKGATPSAVESDGEDDRSKSSDSGSAPKVPPLKIVIPQSTTSEQEQGNRNGKSTSNRSHQLPYVVASSNSNDSMDKDPGTTGATSGTTSPLDNSSAANKGDEKKDFSGALDNDSRSTHHQRVLRSSNRSGNGGQSSNGAYSNSSPLPSNAADRSNNSSPQQRHHSPTPEAGGASETGKSVSTDSPGQGSTTTMTTKSSSTTEKCEKVEVRKEPEPSESSTKKDASSSETSNASSQAPVELHPRKRKIKSNKEAQQTTTAEAKSDTQETASTSSEIHPHDQPITNCYQLFLNIRKQIDKRRKNLFPVQPKPPQGFKDYLMNRCTYVLAGTNKEPLVCPPKELLGVMRELYIEQEKERYRLRMQHVVEKEKLVLSVEQEILRVHGRAARALANQSLPFSVCTILKDDEVYNVITPEQEEKDRNARSRYNGRLFLSWLQDVDDKWEKIKEGMLLRHHNEAESLHAVQLMDWEWKLKEIEFCAIEDTPQADDYHVPMVHVSDDFDLLPA
ncbi:uncharacterized protein LOC131670062 isoform X2 [Phymastichus coffea]|uniref:uncharacterized protein LOC131670062 isoform X2 n=1 Tax=Phymastichus coffea TaxID=108790 RepID=UPI00273C50D9|nr:uncharacterized protein LOC131670062 isoform X2 [Phymastichus coffea]